MSRRDIIIIAVLTNIGLLAVLFMMAINTEDETRDTPLVEEVQVIQTEASIEIKAGDKDKVVLAQHNEADEVDTLLKDFAESNSIESEKVKNSFAAESALMDRSVEEETFNDKAPAGKTQGLESYIEITVKKGDVLSKIAKANGTTIQKIKKMNNLSTDQLRVGQLLKIPREAKTSSIPVKPDVKGGEIASNSQGDYYVIQTGDNPWKIAKKFGVSVGDFLKMNNLDEKKAKNLKVGQRVRVK